MRKSNITTAEAAKAALKEISDIYKTLPDNAHINSLKILLEECSSNDLAEILTKIKAFKDKKETALFIPVRVIGNGRLYKMLDELVDHIEQSRTPTAATNREDEGLDTELEQTSQDSTLFSVIPNRTIMQQLGITIDSYFYGLTQEEANQIKEENSGNEHDRFYEKSVEKYYGAVQKNINRYTPWMPTAHKIIAAKKNLETTTDVTSKTVGPLNIFFLRGFDAVALGEFPCLDGAVVQVAGQANGTENLRPIVLHPITYPNDRTQGPRAQMMDSLAALARYYAELKAGGYDNCVSTNTSPFAAKTRNLDKQRPGLGCDFLAEWRKDPVYRDIFEERDGYIHPRVNQEKNAIDFLNRHLDALRINVERINPQLNPEKSMIQVITFAFALGLYGNRSFTNDRPTNDLQKQQLDEACSLLLEKQYRLTAMIAIIEARNNPGKRTPLVLTRVGGGVFENNPEVVDKAIAEAIQEVQNSGVSNIDVCVSAYADNELRDVQTNLRLILQTQYNEHVVTPQQLAGQTKTLEQVAAELNTNKEKNPANETQSAEITTLLDKINFLLKKVEVVNPNDRTTLKKIINSNMGQINEIEREITRNGTKEGKSLIIVFTRLSLGNCLFATRSVREELVNLYTEYSELKLEMIKKIVEMMEGLLSQAEESLKHGSTSEAGLFGGATRARAQNEETTARDTTERERRPT